MAKKEWQIRGSVIYLFTLLGIFLGILIPVGVEWLSPFIGLFFYFKLKKDGRVKKLDGLDIFLMILFTIGLVVGLMVTGLLVLSNIPWLKLILVGIAADVFATFMAGIPIFGDFLSGLLALILCMTVVGGLPGIFLGLILAIISIIPGPSLGLNTISLIVLKLIAIAIFGG